MEKLYNIEIQLPPVLKYSENFLKFAANLYNEHFKKSIVSIQHAKNSDDVISIDQYSLVLEGVPENESESFELQIDWLKQQLIQQITSIYKLF